MQQLFNRIIAWGEPKGLYNIEYQPLPQIGFLLEELHEVNKEFIAGDIDKAVGEICDLIVYSVNALMLMGFKPNVYNADSKFEKSTPLNIIHKIEKEISRITQSAVTHLDAPSHLCYLDLIHTCLRAICTLGYSPQSALEETVKKIESRRGVMNPNTGKWEKEKNQADVYIPDYSKAKIKA